MCAAGEIIAWTENGMKTLKAGDIIECKPGTKRVTYAVTDAIGITVHKTDKTDLDEIKWKQFKDDLEIWDRKKLKELGIKAKWL